MDISFRPNEKAILVGYDGPILDENGDGYIESIDLKTNTVKLIVSLKEAHFLCSLKYIISLDGSVRLTVRILKFTKLIMSYGPFMFQMENMK